MNKPKGPVWYKEPVKWLFESQEGYLLLFILVATAPLCWALWEGFRDASLGRATVFRGSIGIVGVAGAMWLQMGNPLNWWQPFFGQQMTVNKDKIARREQSGETAGAVQQEIRDWVKEMAKSRFYELNPYTYKFLKKADAAMFKLAWG